MPNIKLLNYDSKDTLEYRLSSEYNNVLLQYEEDALHFMVDPDVDKYNNKEIFIDVKDSNNTLLKTYIFRIFFTYEDPDVFQIFYGNNKELVN